jgi:hypothetical protein
MIKGYFMFKRLLPVVAGSLFLTACSGGTPTCSDTETVDLVIEISNEELISQLGSEFANLIEMEVDAIRTTGHNSDIDTYECAADLVMKGPGGENAIPVEYTVESTDENDEFYVTVYGL